MLYCITLEAKFRDCKYCSNECRMHVVGGPPRWPSGQGIRLESGRSRVGIPLEPGFFRGPVLPVISKLALQWLSCQAPGMGSALGLVGPVSVYCDWVR